MLLRILDFLKEIDTQFFFVINGHHTSFLDTCMHYASTKLFWLPLYIFFLVLLLKYLGKQTFLILIFIALTIALSDQICLHAFKNVFMRYRPCHNTLLAARIHLVDDCGGMYGFISSHAANTFALAFFLYKLLGDKFKFMPWLFVWAAFVCYSRIYLGQHYPSDVFVGSLIGLLVAWMVSKLYFYTKDKLLHV